MKSWSALVVTCIAVLAAAGCATTGGRATGGSRGREAPAADVEAIRAGLDQFLKDVATGDYDAIAAMACSSQAQGFDARAYVEDRFRMKSSQYQIVYWDASRVGVTPVGSTGDMLSSAVVTVREMISNQAKPLYVNIYWRKDRGRWCILPYPQA